MRSCTRFIPFAVMITMMMVAIGVGVPSSIAHSQCPIAKTINGEAAGDFLGGSVSGAGDVDNDGYADVIVGAAGNDSGGTSAGRAYVYSGQTGALLYTFTGETAFDLFGSSVSGAGDVNDDGYADVIVGAYGHDSLGANTGRAYVFLGGAGPFPISTHAGDAHVIFTGEAQDDDFGYSVSGAGDVDSNGFDDLIIGARGNDAGGTSAGRAYVYSGQTGTLLHTFNGEAANDQFGWSLSGAGDVDNDGYADVIVGARGNDAGGSDAGRAYVYSGQTGALLHTFTGTMGESLGTSVAEAGDVDDDGFADLIVGAPFLPFLFSPGRAYVYSGQDGALIHTLEGGAGSDYFGGSVSGVGDVDNDGYADLVVGAFLAGGSSGVGRAYVHSGLTGTLLYTIFGETVGDGFGGSVSGAGDVDDDGFDDLIVGAPEYFVGDWDAEAGRAYVFTSSGCRSDCPPAMIFSGHAEADELGSSVSGAGDVDNDGYSDVIVGASNAIVGTDRVGRAYVYSGRTEAQLHTFTGEAAWDYFGGSVSGAGDVDNDGYSDLIVGAGRNDAGGTSAGRAYTYSGQSGAVLHTFTGAAAEDGFGWSVSGAGDIDSNGHDDLIVGARGNDAGGIDAGRAYVYSGLTGAVLRTFTGEAAGDGFGVVASAGDVDKDGHGDVIVGASENDANGTDAGRVYVYSGRTGVLLHTFSGEAAGNRFGGSVSGAGDVDGDGYADLIVGAESYGQSISPPYFPKGRAYVYSGQTGALLYTFTGKHEGDGLGGSVSGAGDVDNDGYADVIVGARGDETGGDRAGRAYLFSGQTGGQLHAFTGGQHEQLGNSVSDAGDIDNDGFADLIVGACRSSEAFFEGGRAYVYSCPTDCACPHHGDVAPIGTGGDGLLNILDIVTLIDEVFRSGPATTQDASCPNPRGDFAPATTGIQCGDGIKNILDVVGAIDHVFRSGPPPCDPCSP